MWTLILALALNAARIRLSRGRSKEPLRYSELYRLTDRADLARAQSTRAAATTSIVLTGLTAFVSGTAMAMMRAPCERETIALCTRSEVDRWNSASLGLGLGGSLTAGVGVGIRVRPRAHIVREVVQDHNAALAADTELDLAQVRAVDERMDDVQRVQPVYVIPIPTGGN